MNISESLPRAESTPCMATSDPRASPSGCSCVTEISLRADRSSSRTWLRSAPEPFSPIAPGLLIEQLADPHAALHRFVEVEGELGRVLERHLRGQAALQESVRGLERLQRLLDHVLVAEDAHI